MSRGRLLLTGADGYIGSRLAEHLSQRGFDVTGLDAGFYSTGQLYPVAPPVVRRRDTRQVKVEDLSGFQAVVHLAELSNDPLGELNPQVTRDINYHGTVRLAQAAREAGVQQFLYYSSCSVYGAGGEGPCAEDAAPRPQSEYARCKVLSERALLDLASGDFSPVLLRNATVYGPSPRMRFDLLLNNVAGLAHTRSRIELTSDGTPMRPLVHVEDLCQATELLLAAPREVAHRQTFNIGGDDGNHSVLSVAQAVARAYPGCSISLGQPSADKRNYIVSFSKVRERIGFEPKWHLDEAAAELRAVFERVHLTPEIFEAAPFTRLKQIRLLRETGRLDERLFWQPA